MTDKQPTASAPFENPEWKLAWEFVQSTGCHLFLTGKAGTGKTTFLHTLKGHAAKRMVVTAPTGVAAVNAGGVTLHSFFQLPIGPYIPGSEAYEKGRQRLFRFSKEKLRLIKSLDLLVIDEISMVRADILDAVNAVLQRHRRKDQPFGGVQLLLIGDLHQLSPVAKPDEWLLLQQQYASPYFFSSQALARTEMMCIELKHIYRQSDGRFIRLLNRVRESRLDAETLGELNQRHTENGASDLNQGHITLTTHNRKADALNNAKLDALPGTAYRFAAEISGEFPEHAHPTPDILVLKKGAQVMFLRNDASPEKRYFNGKIGRIAAVSSEQIRVAFPDDAGDIPVEPVEWENIQYKIDENEMEIREHVIGKFKQFPLKLAWAITIHKSQGLTFEKAVIDVQSAFAHGQVYVALSRCKSLDGMRLSAPIPAQGVEADPMVRQFDQAARRNPPDEDRLQAEKERFQQQLLLECFDLQRLGRRLDYLVRVIRGNTERLQVSGVPDVIQTQEVAHDQLLQVSEKFRNQLRRLFRQGCLPASDAYVLERIGKASHWFQEKFALILDPLVHTFQVETDNQELGKTIGRIHARLRQEIAVKLAGIKACENGFSPSHYLRSLSKAEIDVISEKGKKTQAPLYHESDIEHQALYQQLKDWRAHTAKEKSLDHYQVLHQRVLIQIAVNLPANQTDLMRIKGVGKKTVEKYGQALLAMVEAYRQKHGIDKAAPVEIKSASVKKAASAEVSAGPDSKQISLDLFEKGFSIDRIAQERGLATSTIEGHLLYSIKEGKLDIDRLLSKKKQKALKAGCAKVSGNSLRAIKDILGEGYSYGEIKWMLAHLKLWASS